MMAVEIGDTSGSGMIAAGDIAAPRGPRRILIAEPSRTIALTAQTHLRRHGFVVDWVATAAQAVEGMKTASYDAVLVDAGLALDDGRTLIAALCAEQTGARTAPVVAMVRRLAAAQPDEASAAAVLAKPFKPDELLAALAAVVGELRSAPPPLIDLAALAELWPGQDKLLLRDVVAVFLPEMTKRCATIAQALSPLHRVRLRHEAHALKGAAANLCARRLALAAAALETASGEKSEAELRSLAAELSVVASETGPALDEQIAGERA